MFNIKTFEDAFLESIRARTFPEPKEEYRAAVTLAHLLDEATDAQIAGVANAIVCAYENPCFEEAFPGLNIFIMTMKRPLMLWEVVDRIEELRTQLRRRIVN